MRITIRDFLWSDETGLPVDCYTEDDVQTRSEKMYSAMCTAFTRRFHHRFNENRGCGMKRAKIYGLDQMSDHPNTCDIRILS